jgi:hypothetical protein
MLHKRLNIVARYNEDLDWVKDLQGDVLVYNKGENYKWDFPKIDVENYGRESETYVRAIIEFYDKLHMYDDVVFLQGHPFDHAPNLFQNLQVTSNSYLGLGSHHANHRMPTTDYVFDTHKYVLDVLCRQSQVDLKKEKMTNIVSDFSFKMDHGNGDIQEKSQEIKQIMYVLGVMGVPYKGLDIVWNCGAMYTVNSKLLTNKTISWWRNLHELIRYWYIELENDHLGYILERLWPIIWNYHNNFGGWKF